MNRRENTLRAARFEDPEYIPMNFGINNACWGHYPHDALQQLMEAHPFLFPNYAPREIPVIPNYAPWRRKDVIHTDSWGCRWQTAEDGLTGAVIDHALQTWDALDGFVPPNPATDWGWGPIDWTLVRASLHQAREREELVRGSLRHGHTFLTLVYLRGYENAILDLADGGPEVRKLLDLIESFNLGLVHRYLDLGVEWMGYPEDLGMQVGPMLSPTLFREFVKPIYRQLMTPARERGCIIHMHSDGDVRLLAQDLLECGIDVLNIQDMVNGVGWIAANLKDKVCIDLDVDRQVVTRFGTPNDIDLLVRDHVKALGSRRGGLLLRYELLPGVPLENAKALMDGMVRYAGYYA